MDTLIETLHALLRHSYAPYSRLRVACLLLDAQGTSYGGVNVENASYGATVCAERNALHHAIACGVRTFSALYLLSDAPSVIVPCGICKQSLLEFLPMEAPCHLMNAAGASETHSFKDILGFQFQKNHIPSRR